MSKRQYVVPRRFTDVGVYLQKCRLDAGLTQREVSIALGYSSAQFISNFERGIAVPPLKKLRILQKLYNMNIDTLLDVILDAERRVMMRGLGVKESRPPHRSREIQPSALQ